MHFTYDNRKLHSLTVTSTRAFVVSLSPSYSLSLSHTLRLSFCSIISVKAKSFADREIRYTLKAQGQGAGTFNIGPSSGIVKLAKELDFEDLRQPHVYTLIVTATEDSGGFSTSVEVNITITIHVST